jgi:hypothetical protein
MSCPGRWAGGSRSGRKPSEEDYYRWLKNKAKEGIDMGWIKTKWSAQEADRWTKEDYLTFIISPLIYFLLVIGVAFSMLLRWYGWVILGASVILLFIMLRIIDPKLKAISEDYELKQKEYLEDLEKIVRWEE